jgi:pimeloyl-ACP methyl ester carboxylesterase
MNQVLRRLALSWLGVLALAVPTPVASAQELDPSSLLTPHLVDVGGGRRMNLECMGNGSPIVVFDQGWGGTILDWVKVQKPISAMTRACFYDRAGMGWSDPSGRPSTPRNVTDDLHILIRKAGIQGPVVLVGHSLGGLYATLFADRFPDDVAGLVLVDPSFAGQDDLARTPEEKKADEAGAKQQSDYLAGCAGFARRGELSRAEPHHCFDSNISLPEPQIAYGLPAYLKPFRWEAMASELGHLTDERAFARSWGSRPVIVLTHDFSIPNPGEDEATRKARGALITAGHNALAARSSRSESVVAAHANHYIQNDKPQVIIDAISKVVLEVRQASGK